MLLFIYLWMFGMFHNDQNKKKHDLNMITFVFVLHIYLLLL